MGTYSMQCIRFVYSIARHYVLLVHGDYLPTSSSTLATEVFILINPRSIPFVPDATVFTSVEWMYGFHCCTAFSTNVHTCVRINPSGFRWDSKNRHRRSHLAITHITCHHQQPSSDNHIIKNHATDDKSYYKEEAWWNSCCDWQSFQAKCSKKQASSQETATTSAWHCDHQQETCSKESQA